YSSLVYAQAGLEKAWNAELTGAASPDPVDDLTRKFTGAGPDPANVRTTLVLSLQEKAAQLLGSDKGAVVMLDPRSGDVLAMVSSPDFNASALANPTTAAKTWASLQADPDDPLLPRPVMGAYVPGSIFKIVTSMAALDSGAITTATTYPQQPAAEKTGLLV